jgi:DNA-binding response OmpR family regulator
MKAKILMADDIPQQISALARILEQEDYEVQIAEDESATLYLFDEFQPDLIILDICFGYNEREGLDILKKIREDDKAIPVIMLTRLLDSRLEPDSYDRDADHFVRKSEPDSLLALVGRCLRRSKPQLEVINDHIEIDRKNNTIKVKTKNERWEKLPLEPKEEAILMKLLDNRGRVIEREVLERLFPNAKDPPATVRRYISELRTKLEPDPGNPQYILTKRGIGYEFNYW